MDPVGPEEERRVAGFPDGLGCFPGPCGLAMDLWTGRVHVFIPQPSLGGRLGTREVRPRFQPDSFLRG